MLNLEELKKSIRNMTREQAVYKVLKEELSRLGYWRQRPRGNPQKGFMTGIGGAKGRQGDSD